jgi:hypothetical protein
MKSPSPKRLASLRSKSTSDTETWVDQELAGCEFKNERLCRRFGKLLEQVGSTMGQSIPFVCQDWAMPRRHIAFCPMSESMRRRSFLAIFRRPAIEQLQRIGLVLVLHDTTEFSYQRVDQEPIGISKLVPIPRRDLAGNMASFTTCAILMHSSLVVTTDGIPLGMAAIKFWTRKQFKGPDTLERKVNQTRIPIEKNESVRWLENLKQSTELLSSPQ